MGLCMDPQIIDQLEKLDTQTKSAFTREYNKQHKDAVAGKKVVKKGVTGKGTVDGSEMNEEGEEAVSSDNDEEDYALLDEEEIQEIKKAKMLEKQQEE